MTSSRLSLAHPPSPASKRKAVRVKRKVKAPGAFSPEDLERARMLRKETADRIRAARELRGLSQAGLARLIGIDKSAVAQWEAPHARKGISRVNLEKVAAVLKVSESALRGLPIDGLSERHRRLIFVADAIPLHLYDKFLLMVEDMVKVAIGIQHMDQPDSAQMQRRMITVGASAECEHNRG